VPVGLPARIALPILAVFALVFLGVMAYLLRVGFGTTGAAFGPGLTVAQQGDADLRATPAPIATPGPGTFTVPQTGTGPIAAAAGTMPGQQTGGGTPVGPAAPEMGAVSELQARIARNPKDVAALEVLGNLEFAAQKFEQADRLYARALALDPGNFDVRLHDADALHRSGHDRAALSQIDRVLRQRRDFPDALYDRGVVLHALGRTAEARAAFVRYLAVAGPGDAHATDARAALNSLGK
jgi:tetratricopeptide (TPR) repeat protein